ncbi:MAG: ComEC/Rec2 family competence protein, partial [Spirochaetales bacterium]|nr:ComEC/Rec2 family competence protein [Spirochaetales bacterium]
MMLCILAGLLAVMIRRRYSLNLCFETQAIACLEGRVVYDSSFTEKGAHLMKISLSGCTAVTGDCGSAKGIVSALGDLQAIVSYGVRVRLHGRFSDGLFIYDGMQVLSRGWVNDLRERLILWLQVRILGSDADSGAVLSCALLLGRADNCTLSIRDRAVSCGCAHVLALSGMHLGILANICRKLFGGRRLSSLISYVVIAAFVFVAGPRPSLVRSALAFLLGFLPPRERLAAVFLAQMVLFPATMVELGCCYGYMAVFGIVLMSPYLEAAMFQFIGRLST